MVNCTIILERVNTVKMNIAPKYSYLFQAINVFLLQSLCETINQIMCAFIWNNKSVCIRKDFMERPKTVGGLSLLNLHSYYWAANPNVISLWQRDWNDATPVWLQIRTGIWPLPGFTSLYVQSTS